MTSLFNFEDMVHHWILPRGESTPLLFSRLLCPVLEHIGFRIEPRLERRRSYEATLNFDKWQTMPSAFHLPPQGPAEDHPAADIPLTDLPPEEPLKEPPALASSTPIAVPPAPPTTVPVPPAPVPSIPSEPSSPMPTAHSDIAGPSTSALSQQYITISIRDILTIMDAVPTFSTTLASFATA